MITIKFPL